MKIITAKNLTERTYGTAWPEPTFPTSKRESKQFAIEYVYRYAQSDYTPPVELPQIKRAETQLDTPEHTVVAVVSAVKTLDYDWWLSLWDSKSQQMFLDEAKTRNQDAAYWKGLWQNFVGKPMTLSTRLETVQDIILELRVGPQAAGQKSALIPLVFRFEAGHWLLTRELGESGFVPWSGQQTLSGPLDFTRDPKYSGHPEPPVVGKSQHLFFRNQTQGATSATEYVW